jgi:23S rRNA (uracil1939-C5)-methyltransferase
MFSPVACALAGKCPACAWILVPYDAQVERKRDAVREAWVRAGLDPSELGTIPVRSVLPAATRDRVDVQFRRDGRALRLGFSVEDDVLDVERCPQASPALEAWIADFRALAPPVARGGARLRVAPDGRRGVWLDLANLDVKALFEERRSLEALANGAIVEIGQRRKRFAIVEGAPRLLDPEPYPWFETLFGDAAVPVYGAVGGFTQPGFRVNRALVETLVRMLPVEHRAGGKWIELGAGIGNFTVPLAARGLDVVAVENDPVALPGLRKTLESLAFPVAPTIRAESFAAPRAAWTELLAGADGIVADPPRSGLGRFPDLLATHGPRWLVYVSCHPESFAGDAARLRRGGYRVVALEAVDQFPQTPHVELVARFERTDAGRAE